MEEPNKPETEKTEKKEQPSGKATDLFKSAMKQIESIPFQPMWDKASQEMKVALKALEKGTERAKKETIKLSNQARVQYDIYIENNELQKRMAALGERAYSLSKKSPDQPVSKDARASEMIKKIAEIEKKIGHLKAKARSLKSSGSKASKTGSAE
jgi:hypothetical protein